MTEIYKICGLGNYNNLFRVFKREFGITPGEYVRQFQERQKLNLMFIKMIVLHKTGDGVKHFLWCVGLHGSFFIMREGVAVHVLFELIRSLPGIFLNALFI